MRWSVVRLIAGKELQDLIRDRRTLLLILVLPAVLYPLFGATATLFAFSLLYLFGIFAAYLADSVFERILSTGGA